MLAVAADLDDVTALPLHLFYLLRVYHLLSVLVLFFNPCPKHLRVPLLRSRVVVASVGNPTVVNPISVRQSITLLDAKSRSSFFSCAGHRRLLLARCHILEVRVLFHELGAALLRSLLVLGDLDVVLPHILTNVRS